MNPAISAKASRFRSFIEYQILGMSGVMRKVQNLWTGDSEISLASDDSYLAIITIPVVFDHFLLLFIFLSIIFSFSRMMLQKNTFFSRSWFGPAKRCRMM